MKKLVCELCGSTNLIKENGLFVCQSCGTQYSVEEARKMMIEGTVNVQGVVQVDNSSLLENYYLNARRAMAQEDWAGVEKYYDLVLQNEPGSIEAIFYSAYGRVNLSLYDADINKRRQIFNVLVNNTLLIAKVYSVDNRDSCKKMIEMIHQDILKVTDSSFVYNSTKNQYGMTLFTDKGETKKLFNALEHAFVDALDSIMQADPQEWLCQMILQHSNLQLRADTANKDFYNDKITKANAWLTRHKIHENINSNAELQGKYKALLNEYNEMSQKYTLLRQSVDSYQKENFDYKKLVKAVNDANTHVDLMAKKNAEINHFLSANDIKLQQPISLPPKIDINSIPEYRKSRKNILGLFSLLLGILSLLLICFVPYSILIALAGVILGVIALFLPRKRKGMPIAGLIVSMIAFLLLSGIFVLYLYAKDEVGEFHIPHYLESGEDISEASLQELHQKAEEIILEDSESWSDQWDVRIEPEYAGNTVTLSSEGTILSMIYKVNCYVDITNCDGENETFETSFYFFVNWQDVFVGPDGNLDYDPEYVSISTDNLYIDSDIQYNHEVFGTSTYRLNANGEESWEDAVDSAARAYPLTYDYTEIIEYQIGE